MSERTKQRIKIINGLVTELKILINQKGDPKRIYQVILRFKSQARFERIKEIFYFEDVWSYGNVYWKLQKSKKAITSLYGYKEVEDRVLNLKSKTRTMDFSELLNFIKRESQRLVEKFGLGLSERERILSRAVKLNEEVGELCSEILASQNDQRKKTKL